MNNYENSKKARRIASVIYLLIMAVILGGTYLSNSKKNWLKGYRKIHPSRWKRLAGFLKSKFGIKSDSNSLLHST